MPRQTPAGALAELRRVRHRYDGLSRSRKLGLLAHLSDHPPVSPKGLLRWHDDLLFLKAFPDDGEVLAAASAGLDRCATRLGRLRRQDRERLSGTGLPGTTTEGIFASDLLCRLASRFPGHLTIDWASFSDPDRLDPVLRASLTRAEEDAFDGGVISTREWVRLAAGGDELAWLCGQRPSGRVGRLWSQQLDALELPVRWRIAPGEAATWLTWSPAPRASRSTGLRRSSGIPTRIVGQVMTEVSLLDTEVGQAAIAVSQQALALRGREVHAITSANPEEVYLADLGEGISAVIIGAHRDARLSLEANYGYVLFGNGVPIGYGGVTPLFQQANTGLHLFPAFRGGEAGAIYLQLLRAFHTLFGVTLFLLNPIQVGHENEEALASGAFWFYYRLGFRPITRELRALAAREHRRRKARPGHRTDRTTLQRLAAGDLVMRLAGSPDRLFDESWLHQISLAVTRALSGTVRPREGLRRLAMVKRGLGIGSTSGWSPEERDALQHLAPLLSLLDLSEWPARDRRALIRMVRAKGAPQERGFVTMCQQLPRFRVALEQLARTATGPT